MRCAACYPLCEWTWRSPKSGHYVFWYASQQTVPSLLGSRASLILLDCTSQSKVHCQPEKLKIGNKRIKSWGLNLRLSCIAEEASVFSVNPSPNRVFLSRRRRSNIGVFCVPCGCAVTEHTIPHIQPSLCDNAVRTSAHPLSLWEPGACSLCWAESDIPTDL